MIVSLDMNIWSFKKKKKKIFFFFKFSTKATFGMFIILHYSVTQFKVWCCPLCVICPIMLHYTTTVTSVTQFKAWCCPLCHLSQNVTL